MRYCCTIRFPIRDIWRSVVEMIQLIILSLCFSMIFANPRMSLDPGYALFHSNYCPANSVRLSDDCKMALRCLSGDLETRITRCYRYGWRLESGTCHGGKFPSSSPCSQNLKGKTALNPLSFNVNENCVQINYCYDM